MLNDPAFAAQRGVTLIELLVAIVIMGVILGLAVPSMSIFIQNGSIRTAAESILNGLQLARAEAVRRNSRVRFVLGPGSGWTVIDQGKSPEETIQTRSGGEGASSVVTTVTPNPSTTVTFNSFGRRVMNLDASSSLDKVVLDISASTRDMQVEVTSGGQIRLCEPAITTVGDVRRCLQ